MKRFFSVTKFLWIGGIMGVLQQMLGDLDGILYHGEKVYFRFAGMMDTFTIYAAIILLIIIREVAPKQQFRDVLLFFVGLDLFYYLCQVATRTIYSVYLNPNAQTQEELNSFAMTMVKQFATDFVFWTTIGLAAAVWALLATKFRNSGKKKLYILMLCPLFAVIIAELLIFAYALIVFAIREYRIAHNLASADDPTTDCYISNFLLSAVMLVICLRKYLKKPAIKQNNTQEA